MNMGFVFRAEGSIEMIAQEISDHGRIGRGCDQRQFRICPRSRAH